MLTAVKAMALQRKATIDWEIYRDDIEDYSEGASLDAWRKIFTPLIKGIIAYQGERWASTLGVTFDVQKLFARDWFNKYILKFAQDIGKTTKDYTSKVLSQAMREGWSVPTMQDRITELFGHMASNDPENLQWYLDRLPAYRSEMIARTETIRASNAGTTELFSEWGVKRQEWLATRDDRVRDGHLEADGQVVAMGEPFDVGGEALMFPGDPDGSPENTINCRCTTIPVIEGMD